MNLLSIQYERTEKVDFTNSTPLACSIAGEIRRASSWIAILRELHQFMGVDFED